MQTIIYSAIRTPDGTILNSRHRHDYKSYVDKNGEFYMIDGGLDYRRCSVNRESAEDISVYLEDGHEKVREYLEWGTRGKDGSVPLSYIKLKDMETDHITNILKNIDYINPGYKIAFENELDFRKKNI